MDVRQMRKLIKQRLKRKENNNYDTKKYEKTINGFLMRTYRNMKSRVTGIQKKKWHLYKGKSLLDKQKFYDWSLSDRAFNELFDKWKMSGYERKLTPSIDRIDSEKGYEIENMQWVTFSENCIRGSLRRTILYHQRPHKLLTFIHLPIIRKGILKYRDQLGIE